MYCRVKLPTVLDIDPYFVFLFLWYLGERVLYIFVDLHILLVLEMWTQDAASFHYYPWMVVRE